MRDMSVDERFYHKSPRLKESRSTLTAIYEVLTVVDCWKEGRDQHNYKKRYCEGDER